MEELGEFGMRERERKRERGEERRKEENGEDGEGKKADGCKLVPVPVQSASSMTEHKQQNVKLEKLTPCYH